MSSITKAQFSSSTNGRGISMGTSTTNIHTCVASTTSMDEIYLFACNTDGSSSHTLTLQLGGTGGSDDIITVLPPSSGLICIVAGIPVNNTLVISGLADAASHINVFGYVNTIVP